jgi:MscS family membrane protein
LLLNYMALHNEQNLFGGVTLAADQPVRVGDFCRFGDRVGTIQEIGLRSTRVRTLDRTVVTVPNSEFSGLALENFAERDRIWFQTVLGLRYETTADQLRHVLAGLTRLLRDDERVDPDPARVRFVGFGAFSLDLEVFAYIRTRDWAEFLRIREELLLEIMDVVAASGSGFAFPSQTIYTAADAGLDEEKARQAIEEVTTQRSKS